MAQTSRWLSLADASARLDIPEYQALALAVSGRIESRLQYNHRELCAIDVDAFDRWLAAHGGDDLAETAHPLTPRDPDNPAEDEMTHADNYDYAREREN